MRISPSDATDSFASDVGCAIASDVNVLISGGEFGHRAALARLIHARGDRRPESFVVVGSQSLQDLLTAQGPAELLRRSAGGTLFIEEATALSGTTLAELLDMLKAGVESNGPTGLRNTRVIAATSQNLLERGGLKEFRLDLFYRLNAIHIVLRGRRGPPKVWLM